MSESGGLDRSAGGRFARYREYKDSGVEWLREIPAHWEVRRLKNWLRTNERVLPEDTDPDYEFDYIDIGSVGTGTLLASPQRICFESAPSRARRVVTPGDTIVSTVRTYLKAVWHADGPVDHLIASTGFAVFSPAASALPEFVSYLCQGECFTSQVTAESSGVSYPAIAESRLETLNVGVPPFPEQRAIARFLDRETAKIKALIAKQQELIGLLQEKRTALISHAVTKGLDSDVAMKDSGVEWLGEIPAHWEVRRLRHLGSKFGSGVTPRGGSAVYQPSGVPFLRSQNVHFDGIRMDDVARIPSDLHAALSGTHVRSGDVLLNITGASIGRVCAIPPGFGTANVNQHVCIIRPKQEQLHSTFLAACLGTPVMQAEIMLEQSGAAREGLTLDSIRQFILPLPPLPEQHAIVRHLDCETIKIDAMIAKANDAIAHLNEYRTALISAAVTGKIDVRQQVADPTELIDDGPLSAKRTIQ